MQGVSEGERMRRRQKRDLSEAVEEALDDEGDEDNEGADRGNDPCGSELQLHLARSRRRVTASLRHSHPCRDFSPAETKCRREDQRQLSDISSEEWVWEGKHAPL